MTSGSLPVRKAAQGQPTLPFSKQFSPEQISLEDFLEICHSQGGDKNRLEAAVRSRFWPGGPLKQHETMAYNAVLSARHYGIIDDSYKLTAFGEQLRKAKNEVERYRFLAIHLLTKLHAAEMVAKIETIRRSEAKVPDKIALAKRLKDNGLYSNPDGTDINQIAGWLRKAGVYKGTSGYALNDALFAELAGVAPAVVTAAGALDAVGQAILQELAQCPGFTSDSSVMQRRLAGRPELQINAAQFKKMHLDPLEKAGFITQRRATAGRGGRPTQFEGTVLFRQEVVQRIIEQARDAGTVIDEPALQVPLPELVQRMRSEDKAIKGKALEQFALRLLLRLGLRDIKWRARPANAEEIDGMAVGFAPVHSRWQVQCKNTALLDVEDAAKEVGIAVRQRSTTILLVTTGEFTAAAQNYVDDILRRSPYTIIRFNGDDVRAIAEEPGSIWDLLRREALRADELRKQ